MKLSKYVKLVKGGSYCLVAHVGNSGIWLGTRSAIYRATELPDMEGEDQVRTVLDIPEKAWVKICMEEEYYAGTHDVCGMDLREFVDGEQNTKRIKMKAIYKDTYATGLICDDGELIFYDEAMSAPLIERFKNSSYISLVARKTMSGRRYIVVKDGFEVLAAFMTLEVLSGEFMESLDDFQAQCMVQFMKERKRRGFGSEEDGEEADQIGMEENQNDQ